MNVLKRISLAMRVLAVGELALINFDCEKVLVKKIIAATAEVYGISVTDLMSNRRKAEFTEARHAAILLAVRCTKWSYPEIGRFFDRDHTTVMYAHKKLEKKPNPGLEYRLELIKRKAKMA